MRPLLECKNIHKSFGGLIALKNIDLRVRQSEILGIIGPNGAGKTTLFNIVSGAMPPSTGEVFFKDQRITGIAPARACRLGIARTYQLVRPFSSLSALENVLIGISFGQSHPPPGKEARVDQAMAILKLVGLKAKANHASKSLTLVEKKLLEIARALGTCPEVLLLDEVVSGLNPTELRHTIDTIRWIQSSGVTVVMIEHVLKVVMELCQRVVVLNYGVKIAEGSPGEVVRNPVVEDAYLGVGETVVGISDA